MKCVISVVVIFALAVGIPIFGAEVLPKNCIESQVLDLLTTWRNGDLSSQFPSLEVIRIPSVDGVYEGFGIKITYTTGDMQLAGVKNFTVEELSVSATDLRASTTLHFPMLTLTAENYSLKGRAYVMYSLKGSGFMKATFQNVKVTVGTQLVPKGTDMQVGDVNLSFSVTSIQVDLADSSWPINRVLNTSAMQIVEQHRSELVTAAKGLLKQAINDFLATTTSSQLLDIAGKDYCTSSLPTTLVLS
ncbi:hypothetical protein PYW07_014487 [Mythimna separata]|uniref:Uncharacterized protein n=1 Tax=Mythimna separata TaxID=271217 RepID=A0AAD7YYV5_MYTSE|nr:hypothetical protein PYW07_014487 [Mythimna separata]